MRDASEQLFLVEPTVWFLAQVKHSASDEWQTVGMASHRRAAAQLASAGYWAAARNGLAPYGSRVVPSQQLEAIMSAEITALA